MSDLLMLARQLVDMEKEVGPVMTRNKLVPAFQRLFYDSDVNVRASAVNNLLDFCINLDQGDRVTIIIDSFLPCIRSLLSRQHEHEINSNLAGVIMRLSPLLGAHHTLEQLVPLIRKQIKDKCPCVCTDIAANLDHIIGVIGIHHLAGSLHRAFILLANDYAWQGRLAAMKFMPALAGAVGQDIFDQKLRSHCMRWLTDSVFAVRKAAVVNIRKVAEKLGANWAEKSIVPLILDLSLSYSSSIRNTCLVCIRALSKVCWEDITTNMMLPTVLQLADDPVAEVRLNVIRTITVFAPCLKLNVIGDQVKTILEKLNEDEDMEVKNAAQAILALEGN